MSAEYRRVRRDRIEGAVGRWLYDSEALADDLAHAATYAEVAELLRTRGRALADSMQDIAGLCDRWTSEFEEGNR